MPRLKTRSGRDNAIQLSMRSSPRTDVDARLKCSGPASGTHRRTRRRAPGAAAWEEFREIYSPPLVYFTPSEEDSLAKGGISAKGEFFNLWLALEGRFCGNAVVRNASDQRWLIRFFYWHFLCESMMRSSFLKWEPLERGANKCPGHV